MKLGLSDDEIETTRIGGPSDPNVRELKESFGRSGRPSELRPSGPRRMDRKLTKILGIEDPKAFLEHQWEKEVCVIRRGAGVFRDLFSIQAVDQLLATRRINWSNIVLKDVTGERPGSPTLSSCDRVPDLRGISLDVRGIDSCWPPVRELHDLLEHTFDRPAVSVAFLTPPGGRQHLDLHWDIYELFVLQISGKKRWQIFDPLIELPAHNQESPSYSFEGKRPTLEVELEEGDMLYTPRGFPHQARTGSSHSLHIAIGLGTVSWHHVIERGWLQALDGARGIRGKVSGGESARAEQLVDHFATSLRRADYPTLAQDETFFPATRPSVARHAYQRGNILNYRAAVPKRGKTRATYSSLGLRHLTRSTIGGTTLVFDERMIEVPKSAERELAYVLGRRSFCPADRALGVNAARLGWLADQLTDAGFLSRHITWEGA